MLEIRAALEIALVLHESASSAKTSRLQLAILQISLSGENFCGGLKAMFMILCGIKIPLPSERVGVH
ncbi:hypothetical protein CEXT_180101 [Caerostris extrusa]|uniref:Uncharacterized protein n=1 Tax=Caerostris extrusa TaxID=172846 RepID=A0AAV4XYC9_CAEEX|nr:hypothetical protein CEXT_180101 [Caerostris extrusa]